MTDPPFLVGLQQLRRLKRKSLSKLAAEADLSNATVTGWKRKMEEGTSELPAELPALAKFARAHGVTIDELISGRVGIATPASDQDSHSMARDAARALEELDGWRPEDASAVVIGLPTQTSALAFYREARRTRKGSGPAAVTGLPAGDKEAFVRNSLDLGHGPKPRRPRHAGK